MLKSFGSLRIFSSNTLKIIAAVCMVIDHIGYLFFPTDIVFRMIGRIAFPIFSFFIAEGCRYTKNRLRYFGIMFLLGVVFSVSFFVVSRQWYFVVLVTFSLAILIIFALDYFKTALTCQSAGVIKKILAGVLVCLAVAAVYIINRYVKIDYGFFGCMTPVFASLLKAPRNTYNKVLKKLDGFYPLHIILMYVPLMLVYMSSVSLKLCYALALPLLLMYNGKRGRISMKYFFYVFYPAHLLALEGLFLLINS